MLFIVSIVVAHLQKTNSVWLDRVIGYYLKVHLATTVVESNLEIVNFFLNKKKFTIAGFEQGFFVIYLEADLC